MGRRRFAATATTRKDGAARLRDGEGRKGLRAHRRALAGDVGDAGAASRKLDSADMDELDSFRTKAKTSASETVCHGWARRRSPRRGGGAHRGRRADEVDDAEV
jgi:hypothetical protein